MRNHRSIRARVPPALASTITLSLTFATLFFLTAATRLSPSTNDASRAAQLIAEVNALRASNGLPPYSADPILMSVAARQNDWRVSAGVTTHTGPDGSTPKQRAAAGGYGGGATIFISENIADGTGLSPAEAVQWWTGDAPHLNTMLGANYVNVGAGAAESGGVWRYTLMAGYVAGGSYQPGQAPSPQPAQSQAAPAAPITKATPLPDGSLIHIVGTGQSLWTIAAVYGVDLGTLMNLNGLTSASVLHQGDEIIVEPSWTPTPEGLSLSTGSPLPLTPAATRRLEPTRAPATARATPSPAPTAATIPFANRFASLRPANAVLIALGLMLVLAGVLLAFRN